MERIVTNFHPDILRQAAFLDKPTTRKELRRIIGLVEERIAIAAERRRMDSVTAKGMLVMALPGIFGAECLAQVGVA